MHHQCDFISNFSNKTYHIGYGLLKSNCSFAMEASKLHIYMD